MWLTDWEFVCVKYIYINIYIHIYYQSKVFGHPQNFLFLILKVLFLIKQVKHHNAFFYYYTKYKSTSYIKYKLKHKKTFNLSKWSPLCLLTLLHWFSVFFPPKNGDSSTELSCKSCQKWAALVRCLALTSWSSSSHASLMGFKSTDCASQDISWRTWCSSLLLMYLWQSLLVCFRSLSCMSTNLWPTSRIPDGIVGCCSILW